VILMGRIISRSEMSTLYRTPNCRRLGVPSLGKAKFRRRAAASRAAAEAVEDPAAAAGPFGKNSCDFTPQCGQSMVKRTHVIVGVVGS
jgi:hypothetical protein